MDPHAPALAPPRGVTPNFDNPRSLHFENAITQGFSLGIAGILFILRCYVRLGFSSVPRQWNLEDWMISLSFAGLIVYSAILTKIMDLHGGVHLWNLTVSQAQEMFYWIYIIAILYGPVILIAKASILLLYKRIFVPRRRSVMWWTIYIYLGVSFGFYAAITIVKIFQCTPIRRTWIKSVPGKCVDFGKLVQASGCYNTVSDLFLLLIPVKSVWQLQVTRKKKFAIVAIFTVGAIAPVFAAIGFAVRMKTARSPDQSYYHPQILLWSIAEVTTGVMCACLPTVPALFRRRQFNNTYGSASKSSNNGRASHMYLSSGTDRDEHMLAELEHPITLSKSRVFSGEGQMRHHPDTGILRTVEISQTREETSTSSQEV